MSDKICIYHGNCADGFTSAWVVNKAIDGVEFHAGVYQQEPPDVTGKDVILVDFSYNRPALERMAERANSILILDHHKTAQADLEPLLDSGIINGVFDMERSGAMITWDYFFPSLPVPKLIRHVQDRDLWQFKLDGTREIQAEMFSHPYTFEAWDKLMESNTDDLFKAGVSIERKHFKDIAELLKVTQRRMVIGGVDVPVANLPYTMSSDAGHQMAIGEPFAACYYDTPAGRCFSLRSDDAGMDVSEIAKMYGGGGHRNAAGFTLAWDKSL